MVCRKKEGLHLGNKINASHIQFFKQKMKVSEFCNKKLQLEEFDGFKATVRFIKFFSKLFHVLNSWSIKQQPYKTAIYKGDLD